MIQLMDCILAEVLAILDDTTLSESTSTKVWELAALIIDDRTEMVKELTRCLN